MRGVVVGLLHRLLSNPAAFEIQQKLFNDYANVREEFRPLLGRVGLTVLDVGCSTGACAAQIVDMRSNRYAGIDVEPEYAALAASRAPDGSFFAMDARQMAFADETFDLAMFVGVLHHMDDELARGSIREAVRVLRPDGRLIAAEPLFTPGRWLSNALLRMDRGRHIRDLDGYRALFEDCVVERQGYFRLSLHRFCSFVLAPKPSGRDHAAANVLE